MSGARNGEQMKVLCCPSCGHALATAYFAKNLQCPNCHTHLKSNIESVTNWEGLFAIFLLWVPYSLITWVVGEAGYVNWLIVIALTLIAHFVVITTFVHLEPSRDEG
jgi:hypothetical protein